MSKISTDQLSDEIIKILNEYKDATDEVIVKATKAVTKQAVKDVKTAARANFGGSGAYANSWASKDSPDAKGKGKYARYVYSRDQYRIAHLLENGHATVNGGRVTGKPHIGPAEAKAIADYEKLIKEGIS